MLVFDLALLGLSKCWISSLISKDVKVSDSGGWRNGEIKVSTEALNRWLIAFKKGRTFKTVTWWTDIPIVLKDISKYKDFPIWKYIPIVFQWLIFSLFFYMTNSFFFLLILFWYQYFDERITLCHHFTLNRTKIEQYQITIFSFVGQIIWKSVVCQQGLKRHFSCLPDSQHLLFIL